MSSGLMNSLKLWLPAQESVRLSQSPFQHGGWRGQEPLPLAKELLTFMNSRVDNQFSLGVWYLMD